MKKTTLLLMLLITAGTMLTYQACQKIPNGFLSDYPYYDQSPMYVGKGYAFNSDPLVTIGSTIPMQVKILHVHDKATGNLEDSVFLKRYPLQIFTGYYDPRVDTTMDMINAIIKTVDTFPVNVNSANGSFQTNFNTYGLPSGDYTFDLQVSNSAGTKTYPQIGEFILLDTVPYQAVPDLGSQYDQLHQVGNESVSKNVGVPTLTIQRVADTPNLVILKYLDKNGSVFDPAKGEIVRRPNTGVNPDPAYLQTLQDYAISTTITDTSMNFSFPFVPFPLSSLGNGYNIYYRIPTQFVHIDGEPDGMWSCNPRFPVRIFVPGTYTITMQFPDVTRVP